MTTPILPGVPFAQNGLVCRRCGVVSPVEPGRCPECQSFLEFNQVAYKRGLRAFESRGRLSDDLRQDLEQVRSGIISIWAASRT